MPSATPRIPSHRHHAGLLCFTCHVARRRADVGMADSVVDSAAGQADAAVPEAAGAAAAADAPLWAAGPSGRSLDPDRRVLTARQIAHRQLMLKAMRQARAGRPLWQAVGREAPCSDPVTA